VPDIANILDKKVIHFDFNALLKQYESMFDRFFTHIKYLDTLNRFLPPFTPS